MSASAYTLYVRNAALARQAQIPSFTKATFVKRFNAVGAWSIEGIPVDSLAADLLVPGAGIAVYRNDAAAAFISGPLHVPSRVWSGARDHLDVSGPDDMAHLWDRIAHPVPATGNFATQAHDVRTGTGETVLRDYANLNAGPSALVARRVAGLELAAANNPLLGSTITGRARLQVLGELLSELAVSAGDLGFKVVLADSAGIGVLQFSVYSPRNLVASVIFSGELGNLRAFTYDKRAPLATFVFVGGGGEGTARTFDSGADATAETLWGRRIEVFVDRRDTTDAGELTQERTKTLDEKKARTTLEISPVDTARLAYGTDYDLGDKVTVVVDGISVQQVIREVTVTLTPEGDEVVVPTVATPGSSTTPDLFDAIKAVGRRLNNVERR